MEGDGTTTGPASESSTTSLVLVTGVGAFIIFSAMVAAFPHGMHLSPLHTVSYQGTADTFFSGRLTISGLLNGTLAAYNVSSCTISGMDEVRISDAQQGEQRFAPAHLTVTEGRCVINGSTLLNLTLPSSLAVYNHTNATRLLLATSGHLTVQYATPVRLTVDAGTITVNNQTWQGSDTVYVDLSPGARMDISAATFGLSTDDVLSLAFERSERVPPSLAGSLDVPLSSLPFSPDGLLGVTDAVLTVDGAEREPANVSLLRGEGTAHIGHHVSVRATGPLVFQDSTFISDRQSSVVWFVPRRIIGLWPLAIATWIVTALVRKKWGARVQRDTRFRGVAVILHLLPLALALYLWDRETEYLFGKSILAALASLINGGGVSLDQWIIVPFEVIPLLAALAFIAVPGGLIVSAASRLLGVETLGEGVGRGTGALLSFLVGTAYIPFFLNVTLAPIVGSFLG